MPLKETSENGASTIKGNAPYDTLNALNEPLNNTLNGRSDTLNGPLTSAENSDEKTYQDWIILLIKKNPDITQQQLAKALKVSLSTVKREMKLLQDRGEVLREGTKKAGKWIVMDLTAMDEAMDTMDKQDTYQIDSVEPY